MLPALQAAFLEEVAGSLRELLLVLQVLLDFDDPGPDQGRVAEAFLHSRAVELRDGLIALLRTGVTLQSDERSGLTFLGDPWVEQ